MCPQDKAVSILLKCALQAIRMYDWLLDLYVVDFFVDHHWEKLPQSWQDCFENISPQDLGRIIAGEKTNHILPLSFLALIHTVKTLSISRKRLIDTTLTADISQNTCAGHPKLKNLFLKHVKLKKRHEISLMAEVVDEVAKKAECDAVLDFGSGLGHLVRMLAYKYELRSAGIECQIKLTEDARQLDQELEYTAKKYISEKQMSNLHRPTHINLTLSSENQLQSVLPTSMTSYGLVGLHPCGDLGPLLLRHFVNSDNVKYICVVGCCYMKLSCDEKLSGYPMSRYVKSLDSGLSFTSREIACHALEVYRGRLISGKFEYLKVHAYRAVLEKMLVDHDPNLRHGKVRSIKHSNTLTLERYCELALDRLETPLPTSPRAWSEARENLQRWRRVVTVYTLRLALAPLVETVVLLDRVLYVLEHGLKCEIRPVFDPELSPRNHIIIGRR